jgi:hypothetical protein
MLSKVEADDDVLATSRNVGFGTVDEWTGTENDGLIVGSAHVGRGAMDGLHALVMAHLLSNGSNGCIKMRGCGYRHRRWHDVENFEHHRDCRRPGRGTWFDWP